MISNRTKEKQTRMINYHTHTVLVSSILEIYLGVLKLINCVKYIEDRN